MRGPTRLKFFFLSLRFFADQISKPFKLIFAVSTYPSAYLAVRLGKIFKVPVLTQLIGLEAVGLADIGCGDLTIPWLRKMTVKICEESNVLVVVAEYQKQIAVQNLLTSREIRVLPLRIDYTKFIYQERKVSLPVKFVHIAYYSPIKGQDMMFAVFARVSRKLDCHLTVIGSGFDVPEVRALVKELQIDNKITFTGEIHQTEIPAHFHDAHILMHTARYETGCAVIQEAMASGVAVCGTRVGILSDIGDEYAVIVAPGETEQLADRIFQLVNDPLTYERMTKQAYRWITTYDAVWSCRNYQALLEEMTRHGIVEK